MYKVRRRREEEKKRRREEGKKGRRERTGLDEYIRNRIYLE